MRKIGNSKTGSLGSSVNMPIASGNLFIGSFNLASALTNALKATQFGIQFDQIPTFLHGYYKFKAGDTFYELDTSAEDKLKPVPGRKDILIYTQSSMKVLQTDQYWTEQTSCPKITNKSFQ